MVAEVMYTMTGTERRADLLRRMKGSPSPVSGKELADHYGVSRQIIVQDIALMRAAGLEILSTNRGYLLNLPTTFSRVFKVNHTDEELEEELCAIVDLGGCVENVMVRHRVYGRMEAPLHIRSRRNVASFLEDLKMGKSSPLKNITANYHYHTVTADSEETLDLIEDALRQRHFLVE